MFFCKNCGSALNEDDRFCSLCGTPVTEEVPPKGPAVPDEMPEIRYQPYPEPQFASQPGPQFAPQPGPQFAPQPGPQFVPQAQPQQAPPLPFDFSRIPIRYRCACGNVFDSRTPQTNCPKCGAQLPSGGLIQIYRMGNFMGSAVGMGVYIDDAPCGHLANKQSIRISVPYGMHKVHVTHTTTRACNDPIFNVTPEYPYVWCKAHFSAGGFRITVEQANPQDMPVV